MKNAMSIDLEDWFCVHSLRSAIGREDWNTCEVRVHKGLRRIMSLLDTHKTRATFFVLGWIAERFPELVQEIEERGHEIALHGYNHLLITETTATEFEEDLKKAFRALKSCGIKQDIVGFRAPSFTIVANTMWALKILEKYKLKYDSSVFPMRCLSTPGFPGAPVGPYKITEQLFEFPISCIELLGMRFPCGGGAYFRILPYFYTRYCLRKCNSAGRPVAFYIHPWELDPEHPRVKVSATIKFGHYYNLGRTEQKLELLLSDFEFTTIRDVLGI